MKTQKDLRAAFWCYHPEFTRKGRTKQNQYHADIRMAWCDFVEAMLRNGIIGYGLSHRATL